MTISRLTSVFFVLSAVLLAPLSVNASPGQNAKTYATTLVDTAFDAYQPELDAAIARVAERCPPLSSAVLVLKGAALSKFCDSIITTLSRGVNNVDVSQRHVFWENMKNRLIIRASDYSKVRGFSPNEAIEAINGKIALLSML